MEISNKYLDLFIETALNEDVGDGDHTSLACIPSDKRGTAQLIVKQAGILAGMPIAKMVFEKLEKNLVFEPFKSDGQRIQKGDIAFKVEASVINILTAERTVLNIMQRMSGIATQTSLYVDKLEGTKTRVLDTRKTTPGMRLLDKYAVKIAGGTNHRIGLFDMILIKDNHIDFAGGIAQAIENTHRYLKSKNKDLKIEIEARSLDDVRKIMSIGGIHRIMFDNFDIPTTREAVSIVDGKYETESSGMITIENIREYALCGVDYVSVGALTHQIKSLDLSLKALF
jgi:nicotinate-nucleotide pyrophosphorylase (carboxylating)